MHSKVQSSYLSKIWCLLHQYFRWRRMKPHPLSYPCLTRRNSDTEWFPDRWQRTDELTSKLSMWRCIYHFQDAWVSLRLTDFFSSVLHYNLHALYTLRTLPVRQCLEYSSVGHFCVVLTGFIKGTMKVNYKPLAKKCKEEHSAILLSYTSGKPEKVEADWFSPHLRKRNPLGFVW